MKKTYEAPRLVEVELRSATNSLGGGISPCKYVKLAPGPLSGMGGVGDCETGTSDQCFYIP